MNTRHKYGPKHAIDRFLSFSESYGQAAWRYSSTSVILTQEDAIIHWDINMRALTTAEQMWGENRFFGTWKEKFCHPFASQNLIKKPWWRDQFSLSFPIIKGHWLPAIFFVTLYCTHWSGKHPSLGSVDMTSGVFLSVIQV